MKYDIVIQKSAEKFLRNQNTKTQERLLKAIYRLPDGTDIKKIKGHNLYRLRIGNYRVIYSIDDSVKIIAVEDIDNRGDVYKRI